jgi:uncharacterized protein
MQETQIIQETADFVRQKFQGVESGHDWWHIYRVWQLAKKLAQTEEVNHFVVELGALLHDIADSKFHENEETGIKEAKDFLTSLGVNEPIILHIEQIIRNISFKGGNAVQTFDSAELRLLKDADRLDAIGAIGIARTFSYGGYRLRPFYDPDVKPREDLTPEEYKNNKGTTINHFYEKLLKLKDNMYTETAKKMALARHTYMETFLDTFYKEWEGEL